MQPKDVNPEQLPENTSKTASNEEDPSTVTEWELAVATKEYHTSSSAVPTQPGNDCVAPVVFPDVKIHEEFTGKLVATLQLSWPNVYVKITISNNEIFFIPLNLFD
jgi:hypothetical protein